MSFFFRANNMMAYSVSIYFYLLIRLLFTETRLDLVPDTGQELTSILLPQPPEALAFLS